MIVTAPCATGRHLLPADRRPASRAPCRSRRKTRLYSTTTVRTMRAPFHSSGSLHRPGPSPQGVDCEPAGPQPRATDHGFLASGVLATLVHSLQLLPLFHAPQPLEIVTGSRYLPPKEVPHPLSSACPDPELLLD